MISIDNTKFFLTTHMGIKDLNNFLKIRAKDGIKERFLWDYKGRTVAIDTSIYLYKFKYKNSRYLEGFFQQIYKLKSNGITPIYIFDGEPPKQKYPVITSRKSKKNNIRNKKNILQNKLVDLQASENIDKYQILELKNKIYKLDKKLITITKDDIICLKNLFDLMNIQYFHPNGEADTFCSKLQKNGIVDMCISDDMDLLVSGSNILLRNFNISSNHITEYNLPVILDELKFTEDQWIDFCILCGSDYTNRIYGVGAPNAYKYIKQFETIENVLEQLKRESIKIPEIYEYQKARKLFKFCEHYNNSFRIIRYGGLWGNQINTVKDFIQRNTMLTSKQINSRLNFIY